MDGRLLLKLLTPPSGGAGIVESSTEYGALYTGIEGLSVYAAMGENNNQPTTGITGKADLSAFAVTYAMGAMTVGYQVMLQMKQIQVLQVKMKTLQHIGVSYAVSR